MGRFFRTDYCGHALEDQLDEVGWLTGKIPKQTFVDKGYKGHPVPAERSRVLISGTRRLSALLCGVGHNLRKIPGPDSAHLYVLAGEARTAMADFIAWLEPHGTA